MAPPTSRRSKQSSSPSPSPNPLPGIAVGIFAAIAAGFGASRALRRKRRLQSLKDEEHALTGDSLLVHEREIAIDEKIEPQCTAKDTITKAQVAPKHMDDLEFVRDAMKPVLSLQKSSAERKHEDDEEIKEVVNGKPPWGIAHNKGEEKIAETVDKGEVCSENEEITNMAVNNQVSFVSDEGSVRTLERAVLMDEGEDENFVVVGDDEDTGEDGDDDRSSADQPLSPVLINGRILDFFEEMSELKDEPDFSASAGNSLSDSVSECSVQEVSSAPVKPSILADDAIEASWMTSKPDFIGASDQFGQEEVLLERKIWSDGGKRTSRILEHDLSTEEGSLPLMEEIGPPADKEIFQLEKGLADSSDELDVVADVLDEKPVLITTIGRDFSIKDIDEIDVETLSHGSVALEGESSDTLIEECTDSARINGKALSDARTSGGCGQIETTSTEQLLQAAHASVDGILGFKFQDKAHGHSSCINGRDLSDKSENQPSSRVGLTSIARPGLQSTVEETACKTGFETEVQPIKGVPLDVPDADIKVELSVELIQDTAGRLGSTADNVLQATRGDDVDNSDATCESSGVMSFGKTDEGTMGISMDNLVENFKLEPDAESIHEMAGIESDSFEKHYAEESANTGHDVSVSVLIKDDGMADLTETVGVLTNNHAVIELNTDETQEIASLESEVLEESLHGEEPATQAGECDITISEVTTEQSFDAMCDGAGLEQTMGNSSNNLAVIAKVEPSAEPTEEMTCLESDPLEESLYAEDPGMQAGGHDAAIPSITTDDPLEESLHSTDTGTLASGHEAAIPNITTNDNPDATYDSAGLEDHSITGKISTENPAENPEPIVESTQGISSSESGPCQEFSGEEPVFQSGRHGIDISDVTDNDAENNADNEEEQLGSPLPPLEDTVEHDDVISGASADKVELSTSRREDELAESGVADNRVHSKQQEIEEVLRDDDAFSDLQETPPVAHSLHRSPNNTREFDELLTREAAGMQLRSRFSSKVVKYLPLEIGLICLLIALVSFLLQYLEVPLSIITNNSP